MAQSSTSAGSYFTMDLSLDLGLGDDHGQVPAGFIHPKIGTTKFATCFTAENPVQVIGASFANTTILPFLFNSQRMAMKELIWGYRDQLPVSAALAFTGICMH